MKNHSRRTPFYVVVGVSAVCYLFAALRPESLPAFQTLAALIGTAYAAMVGHHAVTKVQDVAEPKSDAP